MQTPFTDVSNPDNVKNRKKYDSKNKYNTVQEVPIHFFDSKTFEEQETPVESYQPTKSEIVQAYYEHYKAPLFFILGALSTVLLTAMVFQSKYQWIVDTLEAKEERQARMEWNTQQIMNKVSENNSLMNEDKADNEAMVNAIAETFKKKEAKIVNE